jgi:hypothetical protein
MRKPLVALLAAFVLTATAHARDPIKDDRVQLKPAKDSRFVAAEFTMGKVELYGYIGDLKDRKKITGIVLLSGDQATTEQKHIIAVIAKAQSLDAFIDLDGKVQPLDDPTPTSAGGGAAAEGGAAH